MNAEDWDDGAFRRSRRPSRRFRSESNFRVVRADLVLHKMHDTRSGLPFVHEFRDAIDQKSAVRTAAAMRRLFGPARDNVLVEAFAMARSCQDTSWPWILRKRPTPPSRSLSTTPRGAKTVRAIKLVELNRLPGRCGAYRGRNRTAYSGPHCSSHANYKSEVAFHNAFYAVLQNA